MLRSVVRFGFENRWAVVLAWAVLALAGLRALVSIPIEPFPDPDDVHVIVVTQLPGKAPEEIETVITRPLERAINGVPGLTRMRSVSMFGLSVITTTFDDATGDYFAREQVFERISQVSLPGGTVPQMGPFSDSTGEIFRYTVQGPGHDLVELKAVQDWVVIPALLAVPGVADVTPFGGGQKQFQTTVDPTLLRAYDVTLPQVLQAVQNGNSNGGGSVVARGDQEYTVRSVGLAKEPGDLGNAVVVQRSGTPIYVRQVARIEKTTAPRRGLVAIEGTDDTVEGTVLLRKGENASAVVHRVEERVKALNEGALPAGVKLVPFYRRTEIVDRTLRTVVENSLEGLLLVLLVLVLFLGDAVSAVIVALTIPLAVLFAFVVLDGFGQTVNLLSLGAIDFGIVVNPAIIVVEAMFVRLATLKRGDPSRTERLQETVLELAPPIFFGTLIIIVLNVPILTFQRVEGRIFRPLALTVGLAILGALALTLSLVPQLASLLLRSRGDGPGALEQLTSRLVGACETGYERLLAWALRWRLLVLAPVALVFALAGWVASNLGTEFLPRLEEGNIWLTATMPLSVSTREAKRVERRLREIVAGPFDGSARRFPEVKLILTQLGRSEDGTDPKGVNQVEMLVDLLPREEWPVHAGEKRSWTKEELVEHVNAALSVVPGVDYNFSQYIQDNVEEALSGVKGEVAVKIYGPDLRVLQELGNRVRDVMAKVDGVADLACERLEGLPQLNVQIDRERAARAGLAVSDIQAAIETGVGGAFATTFVETDRKFDVTVRLERGARSNPERIGGILVPAPDGSLVPVAEVASVKIQSGAAQIQREANSRRIAIKCGIRSRDLGSFIREAMERVDREVVHGASEGGVSWKPGYRITWEGQFENQQRAMQRLGLIVPLCGIIILGLLFFTFRSLRTAALIMTTVPLALVGGVFGLWFLGIYLSVSASIGFITLCGVAVENGIVLVSRIHTLRDHGKLPLEQAIVRGSADRLRAVLMTGLTAALGFLPSVVSTGMGAEVRKPLAAVVVFGILTATAFTLIVLPCLYRTFEQGPVEAPGLGGH